MHFISRSHLKEIVRKKTGGDKNTGKTAEEGEGGLSYVWEGLSPQAHACLRFCRCARSSCTSISLCCSL